MLKISVITKFSGDKMHYTRHFVHHISTCNHLTAVPSLLTQNGCTEDGLCEPLPKRQARQRASSAPA